MRRQCSVTKRISADSGFRSRPRSPHAKSVWSILIDASWPHFQFGPVFAGFLRTQSMIQLSKASVNSLRPVSRYARAMVGAQPKRDAAQTALMSPTPDATSLMSDQRAEESAVAPVYGSRNQEGGDP